MADIERGQQMILGMRQRGRRGYPTGQTHARRVTLLRSYASRQAARRKLCEIF